jgi:hypothetical protein
MLIQRKSRDSKPSRSSGLTYSNDDLFKTEGYPLIGGDLPFELTKEQLDKFYFRGDYEDSTHDSQ